MSNDLNQCNFIGRLGSDIELKYMTSGDAVANVSIAVGSQWKNKSSGEKQESTEWVRLVAYGKLAEIMSQYLSKGSKIFVSGKMKTRKWTDQNQIERYSTEVVVNEMNMLDTRYGAEPASGVAESRPRQKPAGGQGAGIPPQMDDFDDDDVIF
jgi:single-strand DNA-binding protein